MTGLKKYKLGDLADIQNGYAFKATDFKEKGIPIIKIKNIQPPKISFADAEYYSGEITNRLQQFVIRKEDILISMTGSHISQIASAVGKVGRYGFEHPALLNQRVGKLYSKDETKLDNDFLYYLIARPEVQFELATNAGGSANQANISPQQIKNLEFEIPHIKVQRKFSSILSSLDDKIELNRRMNQTLEQIAATLFKKYFVEEIDPDNLPEGWKKGTIKEIYKTTSGGTPSRSKPEYYEGGTIAWVKSKELNGDFIIETEEKITEAALKNSSAKLLPRHTVLVAMYGATVGEIATLGIEATCNQAICAILPNSMFPYSFVFQFLKLNKEELINRASGSAQQNISQVIIQNFELAIPPTELVNRYDEVANNLFLKVESNLKENKTLSTLRDSLLPKLMSGEINLSNIHQYEQLHAEVLS